ncbi:MAG: TIGR00341 family protein [Phycisphaerales bacterium]|nr:MAG: TIGR00341 family protein [Phycisphaerales bacterium]
MADRLIQIVVPVDRADQTRELIRRAEGVESWHDSSDAVHVFAVQVPAEQAETVLDPIQAALSSVDGFRAFVLPIEAALPRPQESEEQTAASEPAAAQAGRSSSRISREELHADLSGHAGITRVFLAMVILSAIVAAVGLSRNNAAIVIGAMVMAPLLGPNMALSLATTLGDTKLASRALRTTITGILLAAVVAFVCGFLLPIDVTSTEIVSRTYVGPTDLVVALAAGIAGALAFTTGIPASLVGVMVAVALLPPLVVCSMLLAKGHIGESLGALLLLLCNVISINLAGVGTFLFRGVTPRRWWDAERSRRLSRRALAVWITLLVIVAVLISLSNLSKNP